MVCLNTCDVLQLLRKKGAFYKLDGTRQDRALGLNNTWSTVKNNVLLLLLHQRAYRKGVLVSQVLIRKVVQLNEVVWLASC